MVFKLVVDTVLYQCSALEILLFTMPRRYKWGARYPVTLHEGRLFITRSKRKPANRSDLLSPWRDPPWAIESYRCCGLRSFKMRTHEKQISRFIDSLLLHCCYRLIISPGRGAIGLQYVFAPQVQAKAKSALAFHHGWTWPSAGILPCDLSSMAEPNDRNEHRGHLSSVNIFASAQGLPSFQNMKPQIPRQSSSTTFHSKSFRICTLYTFLGPAAVGFLKRGQDSSFLARQNPLKEAEGKADRGDFRICVRAKPRNRQENEDLDTFVQRF